MIYCAHEMCWALCNQNREGLLFCWAPEVTLEHCCKLNPAIEKEKANCTKRRGVSHRPWSQLVLTSVLCDPSRAPMFPPGMNMCLHKSLQWPLVMGSHSASPYANERWRLHLWRPNALLFLNLREAAMHSTVSSQLEKRRRNTVNEELSGQTSHFITITCLCCNRINKRHDPKNVFQFSLS